MPIGCKYGFTCGKRNRTVPRIVVVVVAVEYHRQPRPGADTWRAGRIDPVDAPALRGVQAVKKRVELTGDGEALKIVSGTWKKVGGRLYRQKSNSLLLK